MPHALLSGFLGLLALLALVGLYVSYNVPDFTCKGNVSSSFSCHADYYQKLTAAVGVPRAVVDIKKRAEKESYTLKECHALMHEIGRSAGEKADSVGEAFAEGDPFCATGYYHGVMEGLVEKNGEENLSRESLDSLCASFRGTEKEFSQEHYDCAHGIGHGVMDVNHGEVFVALQTCDLLSDEKERHPCWAGVFMENFISMKIKGFDTKYQKPEDPLYPCNVIEKKYRRDCYTYQNAFTFEATGSIEKTFAACREIPDEYHHICFQIVGTQATLGLTPRSDTSQTRDACLKGENKHRERENCVIGAVMYIIDRDHSYTEGKNFCSSLPEELQKVCFSTAKIFYDGLSSGKYVEWIENIPH